MKLTDIGEHRVPFYITCCRHENKNERRYKTHAENYRGVRFVASS